jgi:hypothetical protein
LQCRSTPYCHLRWDTIARMPSLYWPWPSSCSTTQPGQDHSTPLDPVGNTSWSPTPAPGIAAADCHTGVPPTDRERDGSGPAAIVYLADDYECLPCVGFGTSTEAAFWCTVCHCGYCLNCATPTDCAICRQSSCNFCWPAHLHFCHSTDDGVDADDADTHSVGQGEERDASMPDSASSDVPTVLSGTGPGATAVAIDDSGATMNPPPTGTSSTG